jgi:hypothetical protein
MLVVLFEDGQVVENDNFLFQVSYEFS